MAVGRRYTGQPLQVDHTHAKLARIRAIADREKISQAQVVRDIIDEGLRKRERRSEQRAAAGDLD